MTWTKRLGVAAAFAAVAAFGVAWQPASAGGGGGSDRGGGGGCGCGHDDHREDDDRKRKDAAEKVTCRRGNPKKGETLELKLFGINDFHGQLSAGRLVAGRPVGSAAVLASYVLTAAKGYGDRAFLVHAGDHVGASPPASALLQDEPAISFLNIMNDKLRGHGRSHWQVIGTLGNHEFDEGTKEMFRLLEGGNHANGPFLDKKWRGSDVPYVNANVVDEKRGRHILAPYEVRKVDGIKVAFIGAVTKTTPTIVTPTGVAGLVFLDEADSINAAVKELKCDGVKAIIVLIHEGGSQVSFTGPTPATSAVSGTIVNIVKRLDDEVDLVVSGHTHSFTNAIIQKDNGTPILVTQAFSASTAFAEIDLTIDRRTCDVAEASASIVTTWADTGPGLTPDADVAALTKAAEDKVAPLVNQVVGNAATAMNRTQTSAGESVLGNFIADGQLAAMATDFAFMNPGGIRADLDAGTVTWGELFTIQPFGNTLVKLDMTGTKIYALLEQQFTVNRMLQISGLTYTWDASKPVGQKIVEVRKGATPIGLATTYTITVNNFLAAGGDGFTVLLQGLNQVGGPVDLDALIDYIETLPSPFPAPALGRITRLN